MKNVFLKVVPRATQPVQKSIIKLLPAPHYVAEKKTKKNNKKKDVGEMLL